MEIQEMDLEQWRDELPDGGFEPFHTADALAVLDDHATGDLELYGGYKGDQVVAMLPVFVRERAVGRAILSPPPGMGVPRLGPVLSPNSPKRRSVEKVNNRFTDGVLAELEADSNFTLFRTVCGTDYPDPRPFVWQEMAVEPTFTYRLDVSPGPEELLMSFSKGLRRDIRDGEELDVTIDTEGIDGARAVYEQLTDRYREQDREPPVEWPLVRDLVRALDERCRVYVARDGDGTFRNGVTVLYSNDAAYFWQGGTADSYEGVSTNSLLQWRIIEDVAEDPPIDSVDTYDLVGANTRNLCQYKSGYGAELVPYYTVESGGAAMNVAKRAYQVVAR